MARPTKHPDEKRTQVARARLTLAEHEHVKQQAHIAGLDVSEYIRRRILDYHVPTGARCRSDPALISEINRLGLELNAIGNNANQLARAMNSGRRFEESQATWDVATERICELGDRVAATLERMVLDGS